MSIIQSVFFSLCGEKRFRVRQDEGHFTLLRRGFKPHQFTNLEDAILYLRNIK